MEGIVPNHNQISIRSFTADDLIFLTTISQVSLMLAHASTIYISQLWFYDCEI